MAKGKTLSLWTIAYVFAVAEGLKFDIDLIAEQIILVFLGESDGKMIGAQVMTEIADAARAIKSDPAGTAMACGFNVFGVYMSRKVLQILLKAIGAPRSKTIGGYTVSWA
jgi:hypothetical protein